MFKPLEKGDPRFKGWLVRERPKGHDRSYTYLYWREDKRLRKQYVPLDQVSRVRRAFRQERQRRKRVEQKREIEKLKERLYASNTYCKGYIKLFLRYAIVHDWPDGRKTYEYKPGYGDALRSLIYRSLRIQEPPDLQKLG